MEEAFGYMNLTRFLDGGRWGGGAVVLRLFEVTRISNVGSGDLITTALLRGVRDDEVFAR